MKFPARTAAVPIVLLAALASPASTQQPTGPVARYEMRAGTLSGLAGMNGSMGSVLGMMMGRQGGAQHELELRLGSTTPATKGAAKAEHFMPASMRLGKSVLLAPPATGAAPESEPGVPEAYRKPKGRLLIYWGCGAAVPKGQPIVIDFAKLAAGQAPPNLEVGSLPIDRGPSAVNSRTFTSWPGKDRKFAKPDSMLAGPHRIVSNYAPEVSFTAAHDFMAPLRTQSRETASGAVNVSWNAISDATGYYLWVIGGQMNQNGQMGDMVWWSSSASRAFGGALADYLTPAQVATLVKSRQVLPPTTTQCVVPAEVKKAAPGMMMGMLYAYGQEENFSYPPRPADPKAAWKLDWTARIRHRSMSMWMLGGPMAGGPMTGGGGGMPAEQSGASGQQGDKPKCGPSLGGMLGGLMKKKGC